MDQLRPPSALSFDGNLSENWKKFRQMFEIFLRASGIEAKDDPVKVATFLHVAGDHAVAVYNSFRWDEQGDAEGDDQKLATVMGKFTKYCEPRKNLIYLRHKFFTRSQASGELFDNFLTDITNKARDCEFGDLADSLIRDRIVCGVTDDGLRRRLLRESDLSLGKCIDICRANEVTTCQMCALTEDGATASETVDAITKTTGKRANDVPTKTCWKCGKSHAYGKCPAFGQRCHSCNELNHYSRKCPRKKLSNSEGSHRGKSTRRGKSHKRQGHGSNPRSPAVHTVDYDSETSGSDSENGQFFIANVENSKVSDEWKLNLKIGDKVVDCKIDTGAQCNVLPAKLYNKLSVQKGVKPKLSKTNANLKAYSGHSLTTLGKANMLCEYKGVLHPITFHVVDGVNCPILGANTCENELQVVKRVYSVVESSDKVKGTIVNCKGSGEAVGQKRPKQKPTCSPGSKHKTDVKYKGLTKDQLLTDYRDVFTGLGCLDGEVSIKLKQDAKPVVHPPRHVPIALHDKLKAELERMETEGVIIRETEPTEWVNSIVTVLKPSGHLRVCLDPRDLNKAVEREYFPMNTIDQVASKLQGAKYFTKLDATSGYWQLKLDEKSSKYCCFNTPFGRYRYLRLPMGINSAPEIFQRHMSMLFEGKDGSEAVMDDLLIWGRTETEHDQRVKETLDTLRKANLKLSAFFFKATEVSYLGHIVSSEGLKPDPEKIRAIVEMPSPESKEAIQRFLGVITYLGKFIPDMHWAK